MTITKNYDSISLKNPTFHSLNFNSKLIMLAFYAL